MGEIEKMVRKKEIISKVQSTILGIIATGGLLTISAIIPNIFKILKYTNLDKRLYKKTFSVNRSIQRLKEKGFIRFEEKNTKRFITLTIEGRKFLDHGINQISILKKKKWDRKWRMIIFDIKESKKFIRDKLRNTLIYMGFYRLQNSVWVYPHDCEDLIKLLKADLEIGKEILYIIADHIEYDKPIKDYFGIK